LADKGHSARRGIARKYFTLANEKTKALKLGCTAIDPERIKRRLTWTLRLRTKGTYKKNFALPHSLPSSITLTITNTVWMNGARQRERKVIPGKNTACAFVAKQKTCKYIPNSKSTMRNSWKKTI
jgi:hypothetical protein